MNGKQDSFQINVISNDKIELASKLLDICVRPWFPLTEQVKNLLIVCLIADMNSKTFNDKVISAMPSYGTKGSVKTALSRIVTAGGLISMDPTTGKREFLGPLIQLNKIINSNNAKKTIQISFTEKT